MSLDANREATTSYGPWQVLGKLGRGGMGEVLLVERSSPRQRAALKLLPVVGSAEERRSYQREQALLNRIEHPNIARLLDSGETAEGRPYLVLEWVDGERIDEYCRNRSLSLDARLKLFLGVCGAVSAAHQQLVIHCDLKPSNVLVRSEDGMVKLLDFGLARQVTDAVTPSTLVSSFSTWAYASPEQMAGRPLSTASDVYSLGVLLFELLTDTKLFTTFDPGFLSHIEARREPPKASRTLTGGPKSWRRALKRDLDYVIAKALQSAPVQRYGSVGELAEDIEAFLAGLPVKVRQDHLYAWRCRVRRNLGPIVAAAFLVGTVIFATVALGLQARNLAVERDVARHQERVANEISDFFLGLLQRASESGNSGPSTIRTLAGLAVGELDYQLSEAPEVRAEVLNMLSNHYRFAGNLGLAQLLKEEAVAIWNDRIGGQHPTVLRSLEDLAIFRLEVGDVEAGCRMAEDVATRAKRSDELMAQGVGLGAQALCAFEQERFEDARVLAATAVETAKKFHGFGSLAYEIETDNLLKIELELDLSSNREQLLRDLIASRIRRRLGRQDPWILERRFWLAKTLLERGALAEAETEFRALLGAVQAWRPGTYRGRHDGEVWLHLAEIRRLRGDPVAALELARRAVESLRRDVPPDSPPHHLARKIEALAMFDAGFEVEGRKNLQQLLVEMEEDGDPYPSQSMEIRKALGMIEIGPSSTDR